MLVYNDVDLVVNALALVDESVDTVLLKAFIRSRKVLANESQSLLSTVPLLRALRFAVVGRVHVDFLGLGFVNPRHARLLEVTSENGLVATTDHS